MFLDDQELLSGDMQSGEPLLDSQSCYTTNILWVGRLSTDTIGILVVQLGGDRKTWRSYVPYWNTYIPDDIRVITNPLMEKSPKATAQ